MIAVWGGMLVIGLLPLVDGLFNTHTNISCAGSGCFWT